MIGSLSLTTRTLAAVVTLNTHVDRVTVRLNLHDTLMHHTYKTRAMMIYVATKILGFTKFLRAVLAQSCRVASRVGAVSLTTANLWFLAVTALDFSDRKVQLGDH